MIRRATSSLLIISREDTRARTSLSAWEQYTTRNFPAALMSRMDQRIFRNGNTVRTQTAAIANVHAVMRIRQPSGCPRGACNFLHQESGQLIGDALMRIQSAFYAFTAQLTCWLAASNELAAKHRQGQGSGSTRTIWEMADKMLCVDETADRMQPQPASSLCIWASGTEMFGGSRSHHR